MWPIISSVLDRFFERRKMLKIWYLSVKQITIKFYKFLNSDLNAT